MIKLLISFFSSFLSSFKIFHNICLQFITHSIGFFPEVSKKITWNYSFYRITNTSQWLFLITYNTLTLSKRSTKFSFITFIAFCIERVPYFNAEGISSKLLIAVFCYQKIIHNKVKVIFSPEKISFFSVINSKVNCFVIQNNFIFLNVMYVVQQIPSIWGDLTKAKLKKIGFVKSFQTKVFLHSHFQVSLSIVITFILFWHLYSLLDLKSQCGVTPSKVLEIVLSSKGKNSVFFKIELIVLLSLKALTFFKTSGVRKNHKLCSSCWNVSRKKVRFLKVK